MPPIGPVPALSDFAPLRETLWPRALAALAVGAACGELSAYRSVDGRWYVWLEARRERVTLARWAIEWGVRTALAGAS